MTKTLIQRLLEFEKRFSDIIKLKDFKKDPNSNNYSYAARILLHSKILIKNRQRQNSKPIQDQTHLSHFGDKNQKPSLKRKLSHQKRFYSMRKKSKLRKNPLSNPTKEDRSKIVSNLLA